MLTLGICSANPLLLTELQSTYSLPASDINNELSVTVQTETTVQPNIEEEEVTYLNPGKFVFTFL